MNDGKFVLGVLPVFWAYWWVDTELEEVAKESLIYDVENWSEVADNTSVKDVFRDCDLVITGILVIIAKL
jgi:hypothetical protein